MIRPRPDEAQELEAGFDQEAEMMEKRQQMRGEPDERYVRSRIEDRSPWAKVSYYMEVYKPILWIAMLILIAAGFGFATPSQKFDRLQAQIDTNRNANLAQFDSLKVDQRRVLVDRKDQRQMLEFAIRAQCVGMTETEIRRLGGVEVCDAAFNPSKHAAAIGIYGPGEIR